MIVLGIDTCLGACSAAVLADGRILATRSDPMTRGHQERLAPLVREVMAAAGAPFEALERVGVTVGPGSFTGLRVGLAFAKGLGAALGIPVAGVGALEALAEPVEARAVAVIDAKRDQLYLQAFDGGPMAAAEVLALEAALDKVRRLEPAVIVGPGAALLAPAAPAARLIEVGAAHPASVARLAGVGEAPPRPIYLRAPDARLPGA